MHAHEVFGWWPGKAAYSIAWQMQCTVGRQKWTSEIDLSKYFRLNGNNFDFDRVPTSRAT